MQYDLCRHIKTNGTQCGSPALAAQAFCFYHARLHRGHAGFRNALAAPGLTPSGLQFSPLEDRDAIQSALSVIIHALASGQLETRRATALFYGLQLASHNAARLNAAPYPPDVLTETSTMPDGLDLALPGATRTLTTNIADEVYESGEVYEDEPGEDEDEMDEHLERLRAAAYGDTYEPKPQSSAPTYSPGTSQSEHS